MADPQSTDTLLKVLDWLALGAAAVAGWLVNMVRGEIKTLKSDTDKQLSDQKIEHDKDMDKLDVSLRKHKDRVYERIELQETKILEAIKELAGEMTPRSHCDSKQLLWSERFASQREADTTEHRHISETIEALAGTVKLIGEDQVVSSKQIADELKEVQECVKKLTKGLECD